MAFYTDAFLNKRRKKWIDSLTTFQYQEGGVWKTAQINSKTVEGTNLIIMALAPSTGSSGTVTALRVYDWDGLLVGSATVSIGHTGVQNTLLKFVLPIKEV